MVEKRERGKERWIEMETVGERATEREKDSKKVKIEDMRERGRLGKRKR